MLKRWDTKHHSIKYFLSTIELLCPDILKTRGRGRPPKHTLKEYALLISVKEEEKNSLRKAETDNSQEICGSRVDHSVIHYWEKKLEEVYCALVRKISQLLARRKEFTFIDSTKFTTWDKREIEFHTLNLVTKETVIPLNLFFGSTAPNIAVKGVILTGKGDLLGDRWYDDNKSFGVMFKAGYNPIVKPNRNRFSGYWRRRARKVYDYYRYKQRSRGESFYGTLTNTYGDRLKTTLPETTRTRIASRVLCSLMKLYIRASCLTLFVRHAPAQNKQPVNNHPYGN